ncbi:hypothetical protein Aduo_018188 [Ancylostoma duodenale]
MLLNDNRWTGAVSDWTPRNVKQENRLHDGHASSRSPPKKDTMFPVSLEQTEALGLLWHARAANGRIPDARLLCQNSSEITSDTGEYGDTYKKVIRNIHAAKLICTSSTVNMPAILEFVYSQVNLCGSTVFTPVILE